METSHTTNSQSTRTRSVRTNKNSPISYNRENFEGRESISVFIPAKIGHRDIGYKEKDLATQVVNANPPVSRICVHRDGTTGLFPAKVGDRKPSPHAQPSTTLTTANANQSESASIER